VRRASVTATAKPAVAVPPSPPGLAAPAAPAAPTARPGTPPASVNAPAPPAPWDWDRPIAPLPDDYVPEPKQAPLSLAEDSPLPLRLPGEETVRGPLAGAVARTVAATAPPQSIPASSADPKAPMVAPAKTEKTLSAGDARRRAVALMARVLRSGAHASALPPAAKPQEFAGPDSELLRLEDEVLALAIEALREEGGP
jgi:hypothetical protein